MDCYRMYFPDTEKLGKIQTLEDLKGNAEILEECRKTKSVVTKVVSTDKKLVGKELVQARPHEYKIIAQPFKIKDYKESFKVQYGFSKVKFYVYWEM